MSALPTPVPEPEKQSSVAPKLRTAARHCATITDAAKVLFDELTDASFLDSVSPARGVVKMSKKVLAQELCCSVRTITRACRELEAARFIWTRTVWECGFEISLWYIRGLANPQAELFQRPNASYGSARGRRERRVERGAHGRFMKPPGSGPATVATVAANGQICPLEESTVEPAVLPVLSPDYGQDCPLAGDSRVPGQGTAVSPVKGQPCPLTTVRNDRGRGTAVSVVEGQSRPLAGDKTVRGHGTGMAEKEESPAVRTVGSPSFKRLGNRAKAAEGNRTNRPKGWQRRDTQEFLKLCGEVMGEKETVKNSGLWVTNLHADPAYAWKVIHETANAKREGRIKTTPAKFAMDCWTKQRLGPRKEVAA